MKKIFYFIASAIVALGAVACQNEVDENITPENTNEITFTVSFDESTRVGGTVNSETKKASFFFEGNETLEVGGAKLTNTENPTIFTADEANKAILNELFGDNVTATVDDANNRLKFKSAEFELAAENNVELSLACPALYFTVPAETTVVLTINEVDKEYTAGNTAGNYFVGIEGTEVTISYSIGGKVMKEETTLTGLENKVYNLGELTKMVYLAPGVWNVDGAWFAAHFFNAKDGFVDVKMTDKDEDGIYECNVPVGMESVIFCRMNPAYKEFGWEDGHVWNKTSNLTIIKGDTYHMIGWSVGAWSANYETVKAAYDTQKADYMTKVYLKPNANWKQANARFAAYTWDGNGNTWVDLTKVTDDLYYIEKSALKAKVIFCRMDPNNKTNDWNNGSKWNQTGDLDVPEDINMSRAYTINDDSWDQGSWSDIFESTIFTF